MTLSEDLCLAIATMSQLDVEVTISWCRLTDDAAGAFVECLQSDIVGPFKMDMCKIDSQIIANALTGDRRVAGFQPLCGVWTDDAGMAIFVQGNCQQQGSGGFGLEPPSHQQ
jgi:hypothetical protein